ncbi:MAG: thioredoxin domain-containing protein [Actinobacteria bacterium]|nr:thioredoxin domain-containing protein [Actinomycetota bacterium]
MSNPNSDRPTKNQRRDIARQQAREFRVQQQKTERRRKFFTQGGIVLGVLVIAGLVGLSIYSAQPKPVVWPENMATDGIVLNQGMVAETSAALADGALPLTPTEDPNLLNITIYQDYLCPICGQFDAANGETLAQLVNSGAAKLSIHPISILNSKSAGSKYSTRSANAAACVATYSPNNFWDFNQLMFANQPAEGGPGLSDDDLKKIAADAGASNTGSIDTCISDGTYAGWVDAQTRRALTGPLPNTSVEKVTGTPTVIVNGQQYMGSISDPTAFLAFITQIAGASYSENGATPTPAP